MICICEPRDASARSFNRLLSAHTIMIFVVPASTDHLLWTMAIKTPEDHNHSQETERDHLGVTRKSPEPFSASGWLPVRIALPDHCRRGWAPINQRAHILLLWELMSVSRSAHFRFATSGLSKHPRTMCMVLSQVVSRHAVCCSCPCCETIRGHFGMLKSPCVMPAEHRDISVCRTMTILSLLSQGISYPKAAEVTPCKCNTL
jgi:hypothetical protein